jgi:hypothetical protein
MNRNLKRRETPMKYSTDDILSNCCDAPFWYPGYPDSDICSRCYEHAEPMKEEE